VRSAQANMKQVLICIQSLGRAAKGVRGYGGPTVRALPGRLSHLSVSHSKPVLHGGFVWARRALNSQNRRFPARAARRRRRRPQARRRRRFEGTWCSVASEAEAPIILVNMV
jgi:hypothetical protein